MSAVRSFTDEDVYGSVASALRRAGVDAVSTPETGRLRESDDSQLRWSTSQGYVFVTFNVAHFAALHAECLRRGDHHSGIIVSQQRPIGDVIRGLVNIAKTLEFEDLRDQLQFLSEW